MCADQSPLDTRPSECGGGGSPSPAPPDGSCTEDWGDCINSRCCSGSGFTCYEMDASYAECRADTCPDDWSCRVLTTLAPTPAPAQPTSKPEPEPEPQPEPQPTPTPPVSIACKAYCSKTNVALTASKRCGKIKSESECLG